MVVPPLGVPLVDPNDEPPPAGVPLVDPNDELPPPVELFPEPDPAVDEREPALRLLPVPVPPRVPLVDPREPLVEPRDAVEPDDAVERDEPVAPNSSPLSLNSNSRFGLLERMSSAQSVIWSLRRPIWSLIWLRLDHRKTPAATAPAAAAAVVKGLSLAVSIQPLLYWLRPSALLLLRPR